MYLRTNLCKYVYITYFIQTISSKLNTSYVRTYITKNNKYKNNLFVGPRTKTFPVGKLVRNQIFNLSSNNIFHYCIVRMKENTIWIELTSVTHSY